MEKEANKPVHSPWHELRKNDWLKQMSRFEDSRDVKMSTSYEIGQSEMHANQLVILILDAVTSHQKFEGAAPSDYSQFHLPLLYW